MDMTSFDSMLKNHYAPGVVENMAMYGNPLLGSMNKKKKGGGGKKWIQPIQTGLPGGGSSTFATAMAADKPSKYVAFEVTRTRHYRRVIVDNETIEASATGDVDAFEPAFDEFDKAFEAEAAYLEFRIPRTRGGYIGRMTNSGFATAVITLDDPSACFGVRDGDVLKLASTDGTSGAVRAGSLTVASVQRQAGTITCTGNISAGVAAAAQNDYIFLDGDFGLALAGFADWVPDTAPGMTAFYGVDRSLEPEYLGGVRVDGTDGRPVHEVLIDMVTAVTNLGGEPDVFDANPRQLGNLAKQLEGKWVITQASGSDGKKNAAIGYKGYQVNINGCEVVVRANRVIPTNRVYLRTESTWTLFSAGPAPGFLLRKAGNIIKVAESADGFESRIGEYVNIANKAPGRNAVGLMLAA